jgi:16S rRNA processing protein RimM
MPYFIEACSVKNDSEVLVKIEGIDTKEVARKLSPKEVWMAADDFNKYAAKTAPISMLGYDLMDGETNLGEIIEVIEQPHQLLCTILYNGNEALIPVHQNNLVKMDVKNKKVYVEVPDGLLEIYG